MHTKAQHNSSPDWPNSPPMQTLTIKLSHSPSRPHPSPFPIPSPTPTPHQTSSTRRTCFLAGGRCLTSAPRLACYKWCWCRGPAASGTHVSRAAAAASAQRRTRVRLACCRPASPDPRAAGLDPPSSPLLRGCKLVVIYLLIWDRFCTLI
jgi:hypothetical protein